jgi:NTE family protein
MADGNGSTLVLGGGGIADIAWMTGLLAGLGDAGEDVTGTDRIIGTSAGANVAAQVGSGLSLEELYQRQVDPHEQSREFVMEMDRERIGAEVADLMAGDGTEREVLARVGAFALAAATVRERGRRNVIVSRLPGQDWPEREIMITAVDAGTGEFRVFDRTSGVPLVDAVAASNAVPGIWPAATIGESRYIDGGIRSADNADLAIGSARVIIVSPLGYDSPAASDSAMPLREVVAQLEADGAEVVVLLPDAGSAAAIGSNPLAPDTREVAAEAGRAQGAAGLAAAAAAGEEQAARAAAAAAEAAEAAEQAAAEAAAKAAQAEAAQAEAEQAETQRDTAVQAAENGAAR